MRRSDREITDVNEKLKIIDRCKVCRLGLSDDGQPYVVPLNFGYSFEGGALTLYFHGALEGRKVDILRKNSRACFEVDCDHQLIEGETASGYSFAYKSVIGLGEIVICTDNVEKAAGLNLMMKHQTGKDTVYQFSDDDLSRVLVYKLDVREFTGKQRPSK